MHVGFTGTRAGMTEEQRTTLRSLLGELGARTFHHGGCVGSDEQAHQIVRALGGIEVFVYPSNLNRYRAACQGDITYLPKAPLERNRDIVAACAAMIAAPKEAVEQRRGGTWSTVREAQKASKPVYVIGPDGQLLGGFSLPNYNVLCITEAVDRERKLITLFVPGMDEDQTVPLVPLMPEWIQTPGVAFDATIPYQCKRNRSLRGVLWGTFAPRPDIVDEEEGGA